MDKYEFKLKIDEMKALVSARNYNAAAEIAETISWRKIRNLNALVLAGEVFEQVGRYDESKEILLMAYDKSPIGRNIIYRLAEIAIKTQRFDEAQEYYDEFVDIAPHDNLKYVLKYKMTAAQGLPYKDQIRILEELKEQEYSEEWAYELAYLYHRDMQPEKCVEACDELILWFGDGIYVEKALELKMHYQPLSKPQEEKYRMFRQKRTGVIEVTPNKVPKSEEMAPVELSAEKYRTQNLQEEIAKGMQQISEVKMRRQDQKMANPAYVPPQAFQSPYMTAAKAAQNQMAAPQESPSLYARAQEFQNGYGMSQNLNQTAMPQDMQNPYMASQESQNSYAAQEYQDPYPETQEDQDQYAAQEYQNSYMASQQSQNLYTAPQEPAHEMTFEEIQAEWERTKQAMQDALQEAEAQEQESAKERSLDEAEQLMQRLLSIIPLLEQGMASAEAAEQGIEPQNGQPIQIQEDLEQAGRIVAGMNQILQDQIDSLIAEERQEEQHEQQQEEEPVLHTVLDPTRELPHLPEELIEGIENGAIEKIEMGGNSLEKDSVEVDNPIMSAYKEAVQPGISAIDLLQRVRMERNGADPASQAQKINAAEPGSQFQAEDAVLEGVQTGVAGMNTRRPEESGIDAARNMRAGIAGMNTVHSMQTEEADANQEMRQDMPGMNMNQHMHSGISEMGTNQHMQQSEPRINTMQNMQQNMPGMNAVQNMYSGIPEMDTNQNMQQGIPGMEANQEMHTNVPGMNKMQHMQTEVPVRNAAQQIDTEAPNRNAAQQIDTEAPNRNAARQIDTEAPNRNAVQQIDTEEPERYTQTETAETDFMQMMPSEETVQELKQKMQARMLSAADVQQPKVQAAEMEDVQPAQEFEPQQEMEAQGFEAQQQTAFSAASVEKNVQAQSQENREGMETEYMPEHNYMQLDTFESENIQIQPEDLLENKEMNAAPEYENGQEKLVFAARPRFLTQAQLQAESAMDVKKDAQTTKEFSKEAMAAARSAGIYENAGQAEELDMSEMKTLTPEQKQIFSYFVPIAGMEAQIYDLISNVSDHLQYDKHALSGNIIIEGISGSGKTVLIMDIIKTLQKEIKRPSGKTGKIDANVLNQKDLDVLLNKISGGCLIIESAGKISRETAVKLSRCMENDHTGTLYILEDTEEGIQKALERDSSFAAKFTEKISIPLFSLDELVAFGKAYANDLDYEIDEMGVLALYKRVGNIQKLDHVTTLTEVKEIVDQAIDNAEKGVLKKVFGILTATRANDDNYVILREKDFEE